MLRRTASKSGVLAALLAVANILSLTDAHSVVIIPRPRNAVDGWDGSAAHPFPKPDNTPGCTESMGVCGCWCTNGTEPCVIGQTCFWFSQGCTIGCPACTGVNARAQVDTCGKGKQPTICDPRLRTYNKGAKCGSTADTYKHNPWRAPNTAPVFDPCGKAGGGYPFGWKVGPGAAMFTNTTNAKFGDLGSEVLKPMPPQATWQAGAEVETMWGLRANHGGGYQWRLCPKTQQLTEDCFKAHPLPFAGRQYVQHSDGRREPIKAVFAYENGTGVFTEEGQMPVGNTWAVNPLPDDTQPGSLGSNGKRLTTLTEFTPPCRNNTDPHPPPHKKIEGLCSGERPFHVSVVDVLRVPANTPPGDYVLGWRWDAEETAQVWSSCSDIQIVSP